MDQAELRLTGSTDWRRCSLTAALLCTRRATSKKQRRKWAAREIILDGKHFPQWLQAVRDAVGFVAARPKVDASRIALVGLSLGGYLAVAAAAEDRRVRAVVELSGGLPKGWENRVTAAMAPVLILHGEQDDVVPVSEARELERVLRQNSVPFTAEIFPGETHWFSQRVQARLMTLCSEFLATHL